MLMKVVERECGGDKEEALNYLKRQLDMNEQEPHAETTFRFEDENFYNRSNEENTIPLFENESIIMETGHGREQILVDALADGSSFVCSLCNGIVKL